MAATSSPATNAVNSHHEAASSSNTETPSKRAVAATGATEDQPMTAPDEDAVEAATGNDAAHSSGGARTPSKRPRISPKDGSDANGGMTPRITRAAAAAAAANGGSAPRNTRAAAAAAAAAASAPQRNVIDITIDSVTPVPSTEVIDISSSSEPPSKLPSPAQPCNASNTAVQIKKDPAVTSPAKRTLTMEIDDSDSEVEILSPSQFPRPGSSSSKNIGNSNNDMDSDEIEVTASTAINPNVDYPHMRPLCGVHPFTPIDTANNNDKFCTKCYCFVCDIPAGECNHWKEGGEQAHCHAHDKHVKWVQLREATLKSRGSAKSPVAHAAAAVPAPAPRNPYQRQTQQGAHQQVTSLIHNEFLSRLAKDNNESSKSAAEEQRRQRVRERKDMRIPEVLVENFQKAVSLQENASSEERSENHDAKASTSTKRHQKMEGDIPTLSLHQSFFVSGVKIGWPFPEIMKPQRQMAIHLIKALMNKKHVVLESPTGTGKSAAILCSVLAWQRHHRKMERMKRGGEQSEEDGNEESGKAQKVKIIYCSRTHSQVAQMVASLKSTPYRPRMAILGSRERLCIHKSLKPRGQGADPIKGVNINNECRLRVRNTEKSRKHSLANPGSNRDPYTDDDPPENMPGDGDGGGQDGMNEDTNNDEGEENQQYGRSRTCPHYRQLTTSRVANLAHSTFVPNKQVDCCSAGGKKSKYGAHDIEDLVNFGVDPYLQKDVALYRREPKESFGLSLEDGRGRSRGCVVRAVRTNTPAETNGVIKVGDKILRVNGSDVSRSDPSSVVSKIKDTRSDPLILDVSRGGSGSLSSGDGGYSSRAACPYYISQVLSKDADIIFAPYNYVLDPGIREALGIELGNSVVILDEAHNVESTLREAGSGKFGEFELYELVVMLNNYSVTEKSTSNMMDVGGGALSSESETQHLCDVAHALLLFVEKVTNKLRTARTSFQNNPGAKGAATALRDWEQFHTPDDKEFEVTFDGPTGKGHNGKCVGCAPFFEKLGLTKPDLEGLCTYVDAFKNFVRGEGKDASTDRDRISTLVDQLMDLVHKLNAAIQTPEHYYAAVLARANGSLEFANGGDGEAEGGGRRPKKKKPRALPFISPRTPAHPNRPPNPCVNPICRAQCTDSFSPVRHGESCNGSTPKWECHLHLDLLTPGPLMQELSNECRTVVLASGSLSPIPSLCAELNLFPADGPLSPVRSSKSNLTNSLPELPRIQKRLQNQPRPLEADHVVDLGKQLFACSIGHFPDGSELKVAQKNYNQAEFLPKLGDALVRIIAGIPVGGVLVFVPSYALLRKCERSWNPNSFGQNRRGWWNKNEESGDGNSVWDRLEAVKHKVIVEPSGSQDEFEEKKQEYMDTVRTKGGCVLLAVYRGKMSEGISFNDNFARGVVCIGLPLPNFFALPIKVKMNYNDEQRKMKNRTDLLPGCEWYNQQAYRAIAQALGRCIRHAADYGAIFLLDIRHCDDGSPNDGMPNAHKNLPKWMRRTVKNVSKHSTGRSPMFNNVSSSSDTILGGWPGLKAELQRFFRNAKPHANGVLKKQKEKIAAASGNTVVHTFNTRTNKWSEAKSTPSATVPSSSPCQSNESISIKQTSLSISPEAKASSSDNNNTYVLDRRPSKPSQGSAKKSQGAAKKTGTLQEMFKKQHEAGGAQKRSVASSSKAPKKANNSLRTMFEKQHAAASTSPLPTREMIDVEQDETTELPASNSDPLSAKSSSEPIAPNDSAPATNTFTFKRSPFANDMLTPTTEVAVITSQLVLSQSQAVVSGSQLEISPSQALSTTEEEGALLCVVCEDGKKEVMLLPCKHMCLCKKCADTYLLKTIKECPMCRATVEDSTVVFY